MTAVETRVARPRDEAWYRANQQALMAEVEAVRARLEGGAPPGGVTEPADQPADGTLSALDDVCACFGLSPFERLVLVLCCGPELDGAFSGSLGRAGGSDGRGYPTFGLALAALPGAHWSALAPWAPLRRWRLVEPGAGLLTDAPLQVDEWVLHVLIGVWGLDRRLAPVVSTLPVNGAAPQSAGRAVEALVAAWRRAGPSPAVVLRGTGRQPARAIFADACARQGLQPHVVDAADLPAGAQDRQDLVVLWERTARLGPAALLIESGELDDPLGRSVLERFADRLATPAAVAVAASVRAGSRAAVTIDAGKPSADEQRHLWALALGDEAGFASLNGALDRVVAQFDLGPDAIVAAARQAQTFDRADEPDPGRAVWDACRVSARGGLDDLAQRLESTATFDDLVVPEDQGELLADIIAHVRHRSLVYDRWGMSGPTASGLGISALFAGPSGTGKTLAAGVLANELALDLYRVDLSQTVSKYIGETEKNLRRIFETAAGSGAVLLFDEADALFGKRSEVRDSHDRYANLEISYLLQAMESYRGLAVLTTNLRSALDTAFLRRLRFVVTFPFPGPAERARIWRGPSHPPRRPWAST